MQETERTVKFNCSSARREFVLIFSSFHVTWNVIQSEEWRSLFFHMMEFIKKSMKFSQVSNNEYYCTMMEFIKKSMKFSQVSNNEYYCTRSNDCGVCVFVLRFLLLFFFFFFSSWQVNYNQCIVHYLWVSQITFFSNFLLKMGFTILFTHLKIILLQYFQFQ